MNSTWFSWITLESVEIRSSENSQNSSWPWHCHPNPLIHFIFNSIQLSHANHPSDFRALAFSLSPSTEKRIIKEERTKNTKANEQRAVLRIRSGPEEVAFRDPRRACSAAYRIDRRLFHAVDLPFVPFVSARFSRQNPSRSWKNSFVNVKTLVWAFALGYSERKLEMWRNRAVLPWRFVWAVGVSDSGSIITNAMFINSVCVIL